MKGKAYGIALIVIIACAVMGVVDAVIQPGYIIKSAVKLPLFLLLPIIYTRFNRECDLKRLFVLQKGELRLALLCGAGLYLIIVGAYFLTRNVFDFSAVTTSLNEDTGVNKANFLWVAIYISFVNSLLEEFFFRGFAFLALKAVAPRGFAYIFSAAAFALYHVAMMIGWFGAPLIALSIAGLMAGALIFNRCDEKSGGIFLSWLIHMSANFAINTIGFMLFD